MLKYKWSLIIGLTVLALAAALPWREKIRLGLDLKGGIHLVIRVQSDDAVRSDLDSAVSRLSQQLEEKEITVGSVSRMLDAEAGVFRVVVSDVPEETAERVRKIVDSALPDFSRSVMGNDIVANLSLSRVDQIRDTTVEQALNTIRERVDATGTAEPKIQREGLRGDRILIQLPGVQDPEYVKRLIGKVAFLELKWVDDGPFKTREIALQKYSGSLPATIELVEGSDEDGGVLLYALERSPVITGRDLARAQPDRDEYGQPAVAFTCNGDGARKLGEATGANIGRRLAIVLDGQVKSAPVVQSRISTSGQISGAFTTQEARELALTLRAGALPAKIQYLEERTVGPWLGKESIEKGVFTGTVGIILVAILMVGYYHRSGINAVIALILNGVLLMGALAVLDATLTLPGIAGFILTLGMAVDANVLVFEAIRENLRAGMGPKRAIEGGFDRAFTTIVDSNLTTLLAAGALWMLGSGPVRGFGVTLFIGLIVNVFTAYFVSRTIFETFILNREFKPGDSISI